MTSFVTHRYRLLQWFLLVTYLTAMRSVGVGSRADTVCCIFVHPETGDCELTCRADHVQAFVIAESVSDVFKRRNCQAHLSVHDGVKCLRRAELFKVGRVKGDLQSSMVQERLSMLTLMSIERSLDLTTQSKNSLLAKTRKTAIGNRPIS